MERRIQENKNYQENSEKTVETPPRCASVAERAAHLENAARWGGAVETPPGEEQNLARAEHIAHLENTVHECNAAEIRRETITYESAEETPGEDLLGEAGAEYAYRKHGQGEYTLEDYYALPDEQRVELIDGVFHDMAAPYTTHQIASFEIGTQLANFIRSQKGTCRAMLAPVDVQLDCDDRTMVQPDVLVVCDRNKIKKRCVYGAPDFIVEILSVSTALKDSTIKQKKYLRAGVREYWIVNLLQEVVIVHEMIGGECRTLIYGMDHPIPVRIFDGKCQIYFGEICEEVRPILQQD